MKTSPKQVRHKVATHFGKLVSEDVALTQHDKNNFVSVSRNKNVFVVLCEPGLNSRALNLSATMKMLGLTSGVVSRAVRRYLS